MKAEGSPRENSLVFVPSPPAFYDGFICVVTGV